MKIRIMKKNGVVGNAKMGTISNCLSFVEIQASGKNDREIFSRSI